MAREDTVDLLVARLAVRKLHWPDSKLTSVICCPILRLNNTHQQMCIHANLPRRQRLLGKTSPEVLAEEIIEDISLTRLRERDQHLFLRIKFPVLDFQFGQTTNRVHLAICPSIELICCGTRCTIICSWLDWPFVDQGHAAPNGSCQEVHSLENCLLLSFSFLCFRARLWTHWPVACPC